MSQRQHLPRTVEQFLHTLEGEQPDQEPEETIHVYVQEDRVTFVRETPETIDSTPPPPRDRSPFIGACIFTILFLVVILASVLAPTSNTSKSFSVIVQGFTLAPVHTSITIQAKATGEGSIAPTTATGSITFYNAQPYTQIIPVGTMLKGQDGIAVITNTQAVIPPVAETFPPTDGRVTITAHALTPGASGNIVAGDINEPCCVTSVIAQNSSAFSGGRDGEHFTYVTKQDVYQAITPLLTTLERQGAQLFPSSVVLSPTCVPTVSATPPVGQKATKVTVTVTVSCTASSYHPHSVLNAIRAYSSRFGQGTFTNIAYQVIAVGKDKRITFFVTATWTPFVARHIWAGK